MEGGHLALGVFLGVCLVISAFLINSLFSEGVTRSELLSLAPALLTLVVAAVSLVVSFYALSEQRLMRQAGTDPVVLVHLGQREDTPMLITLEVSNVGAGAALNVELKAIIKDDWPHLDRVIRDPRELTHEIKTILQNSSVSYPFGVGHQLIGSDPIEPFEIQLNYEDIEGSKYSSIHTIDVRELTWQDAHTPSLTHISQQLEKMQKSIAKLTRHDELHVVAETQSEYDARKARERKEMQERFKKQKEKD